MSVDEMLRLTITCWIFLCLWHVLDSKHLYEQKREILSCVGRLLLWWITACLRLEGISGDHPRALGTGLCCDSIWISPRLETPLPPWATSVSAWSLSQGKNVPGCLEGTACVSGCAHHTGLLTGNHWKSLALSSLPAGVYTHWWDLPEPSHLQLSSPSSLSFSSQEECPGLPSLC